MRSVCQRVDCVWQRSAVHQAQTMANVKPAPGAIQATPQLSASEAMRLGAALASEDAGTVKQAAEAITQLCFDGPKYDSGKSVEN